MRIYSDAIQKEVRRISDSAIGLQATPAIIAEIKRNAEKCLEPFFGFPLTITVAVGVKNDGYDLLLTINRRGIEVRDARKVSSSNVLPRTSYSGSDRPSRKPGECFVPDCAICR